IHHAFGDEEKLELELAQREILRMRQIEMDQLKWAPTIKSSNRPREIYPYVFDACIDSGSAMITINGMKLGQLGFQGFEKLNVIQSVVFEQAYKTRENLLICAPTGA
ncbi:hypothetical protein TELCIR_25141, partial [Teladorsagia circumcincta]